MPRPPAGLALSVALLMAGCSGPGPAAGEPAPVPAGGSCRAVGGLPDRRCTPGEADPRVTPANVAATICRRGYSASVRPSRDVSHAIKIRTSRAYGLQAVPFAQLELDHLVPLSIGGASTDRNLWPELRAGASGAATKDAVEERLHREVCAGRIGLRAAQTAIARDWRTVR